MVTYKTPGVYVEEIQAGSRPIEGASTSVAAFVGFTQKGPLNEPVEITDWSQYRRTFGGYFEGGYLPHAINGFFENGGTRCYVVSVWQPPRPRALVQGTEK